MPIRPAAASMQRSPNSRAPSALSARFQVSEHLGVRVDAEAEVAGAIERSLEARAEVGSLLCQA